MTILQLDYDSPLTQARRLQVYNRVAFVSDTVHIHLEPPVVFEKTRRGFHVLVASREDLSPLMIVVLQALLGSDLKRETFNLQRALVLEQTPAFWRDRWNVLYIEKLENHRQ